MITTIDFSKLDGLVPAIIQDATDGTVLMLGFMNKEAVQRTLDERQVVFWSRSKQRLWKKGETSGNHLNVLSIEQDCDNDTLLFFVKPDGPTCHTGKRSCFSTQAIQSSDSVQQRLFKTILERKEKLPQGSYTTELFKSGIARIGQKVGEEGVELAIASQYEDKQRCIEEAADLVYHLQVLLAAKEISLTDVENELQKRMK